MAGGFIVALLFAIFTIRKGGRDAERKKQMDKEAQQASEIRRQDAAVQRGAGDVDGMRDRLSDALRRERDS